MNAITRIAADLPLARITGGVLTPPAPSGLVRACRARQIEIETLRELAGEAPRITGPAGQVIIGGLVALALCAGWIGHPATPEIGAGLSGASTLAGVMAGAEARWLRSAMGRTETLWRALRLAMTLGFAGLCLTALGGAIGAPVTIAVLGLATMGGLVSALSRRAAPSEEVAALRLSHLEAEQRTDLRRIEDARRALERDHEKALAKLSVDDEASAAE